MKLSIIMPVYNVEKYLGISIETVLNQTLKDFELIIVNDGSTDSSYEICKLYNQRYSCIKLISQENRGLSAARNTGLKYAVGEYIAFIDSDDMVREDMYEIMYNYAKKGNYDIVLCDFGKIEDHVDSIEECKQVNNAELPMEKRLMGYAWNKIYRHTLFKDLDEVYDEGTYYEDNLGSLRMLDRAEKIGLVKEKLYYYRMNPKSITKTYTVKHMTDMFKQAYASIEYYKTHIAGKKKSIDKCDILEMFVDEEKFIALLKETAISALTMYPSIMLNNKKWIQSLKNKTLILFGASKAGEVIIEEWEKHGLKPSYLCDNDRNKWGKKLRNIEIISPEKMIELNDSSMKIFISSIYIGPIYRQLKQLHVVEDICDLYDFELLKRYMNYDIEGQVKEILEI